jgi:hypothetical protein
MSRLVLAVLVCAAVLTSIVMAEEYQQLGVNELTVNKLRASDRSVIQVTDYTALSNATFKVYCSNLVVKAGGTATLPSGSVSVSSLGTGGTYPANSGASITNIGSASIADGSLLGADLRTNTVGKANLAAADFGDFTVGADGTCTLDGNVVLSATVSDGTLLGSDIRTNTVGKANLAAADFGSFTVGADGTCTIDASAITTNMIQAGLYSGTVTNNPTTTNVYVIVNGLVVTVTQL